MNESGSQSLVSFATDDSARRGWRLVGIQLLLLAAAFALCWPTTALFVAQWSGTNATYTHGFLIVAIAAWLIVRNRQLVATLPSSPSMIASLAVAVIGLIWLFAARANIQTVHQGVFPLLAWTAVYVALGRRIAMASVFPFAYLLLGTVVWGAINGALQWLTVLAVGLLLRTAGIPAFVEGNLIHLPVGTFEVAGGCSGLHFFIVALALGSLYGEIHRDTPKARLQHIAIAAAFSLLANWMRVFVIIVAGYLTDMQHYLVRVDHYRFGWLVFAVAMISFFLIVRRLPVTADAATPDSRGPIHESNRVLSGIAVALAAMAIGPAWNLLASNRSSATAIPEWPIATRVNNWDGPVQPSNVWRPTFSGVDRQQQVDYSNGEARVRTYVGTYLSQAQGKEMVNSENSWAEAEVTATVVGHHPVQGRMDVAEVTIEEGAALSRIRYQYRVDDLRTAHGLYAQLWYAAISLIRQPVATVIAVRSDCVGDCQAAGAALDDFWRASGIDER